MTTENRDRGFINKAPGIVEGVENAQPHPATLFALIVAFINRYDKDAGIGTVIATMLPYSVAFPLVWTVLLIPWSTLGIPIGPDTPIGYNFVLK